MRVEELLNRKSIRYSRSGKDFVIKCLNPEHDDSNPSMRVDTVLGIFNCLACGYSGNLFKLYNEQSNPSEIKKEKVRRKIEEIRGSSFGQDFPTNYAPFISSYRGISRETLIKFKAFTTSEYGMENRIVFPIYSPDDRVVAFLGRDMYDLEKSKYMIYPKKTRIPMYPVVTPIKGRVILVEGIFDMLNLHDKGLTNAIACFGLQTIKEEDLYNFKLQEIVGIDILFDGDDAGRTEAPKLKERIADLGLFTRVVNLKDGKDPGDMSSIEVSSLKRVLYD